MTLYVKGKEDKFWHWEEECKNYPKEIDTNTVVEQKEDLCPECYKIRQEKNKNIKFPAGSVVRGGRR